ncbi:NAD(P)-dependent oxidoreductase [Novosphingobium sp. Gsoil 351]|uniref:NAD-dependent epimerase/dehydratase family protein n=1 Tax=Novosphingobium sp. Gsoil 351 TaxID=2675225 RepID=UPI0012B45081|nr:NAD(P)-dependent oxidoreductase [Novosphingobium sp. Gsoil 351]QGN54950.1 NAD-dependent epimerase/dehydratase family protein [Novosphingobium sp. Gsoil 351]
MTAPRILIVGASGRLGGFLRRAWREETTPFVSVFQHRRSEPGALNWSNLAEPAPLLRERAATEPFAAMVMLAGALPGRGAALSNAGLAEMALSAAHAAEIPRVLLASSAAVYGAGRAPYAEDDPCTPLSDYGADKLAMETVGESWRSRGLEVTSLRIGNVVGADALLGYADMDRAKVIDIYPDGRGPVRSWLGPRDWAKAVAALVRAPGALPRTINLASEPPFAMDELADAARLNWAARPARADPRQVITLDTSLLGQLTRVPVDTSLEALITQWRDFGSMR